MIQTVAPPKATYRFVMQGLVQGQGVRPTIARLARKHGVAGSVCNSNRGVEIIAVGETSTINGFETALRQRYPQVAFVSESADPSESTDGSSFQIRDSEIGDGLCTAVPLDLAICQDCINDIRSCSDWRCGYPFVTCAHCGPRYSILRRMPFDRMVTTMDAFPMCARCEAEYRDPGDRRFHAQTICCPNCGPRCWVTDRQGNHLAGTANAVEWIAERIAAGEIAAVKGIGGYQLVCDASNDEAVKTLRTRKHRPSKPLPIMVSDANAAEQLALIREIERKALQSPAGPIVLLRIRNNADLSRWISPHLDTVGIMLPTSALHLLLSDRVGRPLVVTSGNDSGSPIIYQNEIAQTELASIADVFLHHEREIVHPIDDSVVQCSGDQIMTIRAARGMTPMAFPLPADTSVVATGGHQKVAIGIQTRDAIVLAPHVGDMQTEPCRLRFLRNVSTLGLLYQIDASTVVHDCHPNYFTTGWAEQSFGKRISVQHHHAHLAAAMLEHDLLDQTVLGISFDGTGFGNDETIWGGEALLATTIGFERIGHLRPFRLPGGEAAIKQPRRIAQSLHSQLAEPVDRNLQFAIDRGPLTSSMGRLFDGVAALALGIESVDDESEAAIRLEAACNPNERSCYEFDVICTRGTGNLDTRDDGENQSCFQTGLVFDWHPILRAINADIGKVSPGRIAMKFHRAVANLVVDLATRRLDVPCVLSGGVFQNRLLMELIQQMSDQRSLEIRLPGLIPAGDGGLAIGQLVIANRVLRQGDV